MSGRRRHPSPHRHGAAAQVQRWVLLSSGAV